ncbi:hypothetical protein M9434_000458 [Picochlorum sp. BPE23]|nr:hypothetical protein M9434_000458 [Picochlorum sp. BPE23]
MPSASSTQKRKKKSVKTSSTQTPLFIGLVAAAVGAVWYLRKRQQGDSSSGSKKGSRAKKGGDSETRSAFKFPDAKKKAASTNLPRNKTNKKNKAKRRAEKAQKKADKEKSAATSKASGGQKQDDGQASTSVINYSYFDTARRDTVIPTHKKPTLSAADIMKKDQELKKQ